MPKKHVAKRLGNGEHLYRGFEIHRNDDVPTGYFGRYKVIGLRFSTTDTLYDAKLRVDFWLDGNPVKEFQANEWLEKCREWLKDNPDNPDEFCDSTIRLAREGAFGHKLRRKCERCRNMFTHYRVNIAGIESVWCGCDND